MKKLLQRIALGVVCVVVLFLLLLYFSLGKIVKRGIETVGPLATKTSVSIDRASIGPLTGRGSLKNVKLGNPTGFKSPVAISVGHVSVHLQPISLLSDTIRIREIVIDRPEIDYEKTKEGTNLNEIQRNVEAFVGASTGEGDKGGKKLSIGLIQIRNGTIQYSSMLTAKAPVALPLPDIEIRDLGVGPEGVSPAEVVSKVFGSILRNTGRAVAQSAALSVKSGLRKLFGQ